MYSACQTKLLEALTMSKLAQKVMSSGLNFWLQSTNGAAPSSETWFCVYERWKATVFTLSHFYPAINDVKAAQMCLSTTQKVKRYKRVAYQGMHVAIRKSRATFLPIVAVSARIMSSVFMRRHVRRRCDYGQKQNKQLQAWLITVVGSNIDIFDNEQLITVSRPNNNCVAFSKLPSPHASIRRSMTEQSVHL